MAKTQIFLEDFASGTLNAAFTTSTNSIISSPTGKVRATGPRKTGDTFTLGRSLDTLNQLNAGTTYQPINNLPTGAVGTGSGAATAFQVSGWVWLNNPVVTGSDVVDIMSAVKSNGQQCGVVGFDINGQLNAYTNFATTNPIVPIPYTLKTWIWLSIAMMLKPTTYSDYYLSIDYKLPGGSVTNVLSTLLNNITDPGGFDGTVGFSIQQTHAQDNVTARIGCVEFAQIGSMADLAYPTNVIDPPTTPTTFYFDPAVGLDSNDGVTPSTPRKTITALNEMSANAGFLPAIDPPALTPTSLTRVNSIATVTVANSYSAGQTVVLYGYDQDEYCGAFTIISTTGSSFTISVSANAVTPATGAGKVSATGNGDIVCINTASSPMPLPIAGLRIETAGLWIKPYGTNSTIDFKAELTLANGSFAAVTSDGSGHTLSKVYSISYAQLYGYVFENDRPQNEAHGTTFGGTSTDNGSLTVGQYVDQTPGSFWSNGTTMYVHPFGSTVPASDGKSYTVSQLFGGTDDASQNMNAITLGARNWRLTNPKLQKTTLAHPAADGAYLISDNIGVGGVCLLENPNLKYGSKHCLGFVSDQTNTVIVTQGGTIQQCTPNNSSGSTVLVTQVQNGSGNYHYYININIPAVAMQVGSIDGSSAVFVASPYAGGLTSHGGSNSMAELRLIGVNCPTGDFFDQGISQKLVFSGCTAATMSGGGSVSTRLSRCHLNAYAPNLSSGGGAVQVTDCLIAPVYNSAAGSGTQNYPGNLVFNRCTFDLSKFSGFGGTTLYTRVGASTVVVKNCVLQLHGIPLITGLTTGDSYTGTYNVFNTGTNTVLGSYMGSDRNFAAMVSAGIETNSINTSTPALDSNLQWTTVPPVTNNEGSAVDYSGFVSATRLSPGAYEYGSAVIQGAGVLTGVDIAAVAAAILTATPPALTGKATTLQGQVNQMFRRMFGKSTNNGTTLKTYADDGTTVLTTQTLADDGTTQTVSGA